MVHLEIWDLYDKNRNPLGITHQRSVPVPEGYYHLVVRVLVQNSRGEILLSKRHPEKPNGNLWECTGGSVLHGESSLDGALREAKEELGIDLSIQKGNIIHRATRMKYHMDTWYFQVDLNINELVFQPDEVVDAKWVNKERYEEMLVRKEIIPNLPHLFNLLSD